MTDRNRRRIWIGTLLIVAAALLAVGGGRASADDAAPATAGPTTSADWPQWRGPNRDGVALAGPKLLDSWPKEGPKLLWKSDPIPAYEEGGGSCIVVAEGRAFVYVDWEHRTGEKFMLTTDYLRGLGWVEDMPDDLAKKIESTRGADTRAKLKDSEVDAYVADFIKPLDPNLSGKFRTHIETRLKAGRAATEWKHLVAMAKVRDKEFPSFGELYFTVGEYGYPADLAKQMIEKTISAKDTVVCLDALTGKQIWKKEFPGAHRMIYMGNCGYGASGTPAVAGDKIYVQGSAGLYCLSVKDGAVIWQKETTFTNSSPLVANGAVYVTYPDLIAYDAETGRLLWKTPVGAGGYSGPNYSVVSWTSGGKNYLVGISDGWGGGLYCIDPDTGKPLWKVASVGGGEGSSSVAIKDDTAVFYGSGGIYAFKLTPQKAEQLWKTPIAAWRGDSMIIYQDYVYAGSSNPMRCLDLKTGAVKWETKKLGNFYSSPILADGKVLYPTGHGWYPLALAMFRATPDQYEELGRFPSNYSEYTNSGLIATCSSPAIADGRLYLRCGGNVARRGILGGCVACYDLRAESK